MAPPAAVPQKTVFRDRVLMALAALNDQGWLFSFENWEVMALLERVGPAARGLHTVDLFANNPFSKRIDVNIASLIALRQGYERSVFSNLFTAGYEVLAGYLEDLWGLLSLVGNVALAPQNHTPPEVYFSNCLATLGLSPAAGDLLSTFALLRLRRNHLVHQHEQPSARFAAAVGTHGAGLNAFWAARAQMINWTTLDPTPPSADVVADLFKVMRILIEELDGHVSPQMLVPGLAAVVAAERFGHSVNGDVVKARIKPLKGALEHQYGLLCPDAVARTALEGVPKG